MSSFAYTTRFEHDADAIHALLADLDRHNRILPFCKGVRVMSRGIVAGGKTKAVMEHAMAIPRIGLDSAVTSTIRYHEGERSFEMFSRFGDKVESGLLTTAKVDADGSGSVLHLAVITDQLPMRYRMLLIEPVVRRGCDKFIEKLTRRAAEVAIPQRAPRR